MKQAAPLDFKALQRAKLLSAAAEIRELLRSKNAPVEEEYARKVQQVYDLERAAEAIR